MGACGLGMAGVCRALVSPEGTGASSSPPRFPVRWQIGGKLQSFLPVTEVTLVSKIPPSNFSGSRDAPRNLCGFCLMIQDTNRTGEVSSPESPLEKRRMLGVLFTEVRPCVFSPSAPWFCCWETEAPDGRPTPLQGS